MNIAFLHYRMKLHKYSLCKKNLYHNCTLNILSAIEHGSTIDIILCITQARMSPSPDYDISECNLENVPSSTYILCEVFRKETLLMQCNKLKSLSGGGALKCLSLVTVLDLHSNELNNLPSDILHLVSLKVYL